MSEIEQQINKQAHENAVRKLQEANERIVEFEAIKASHLKIQKEMSDQNKLLTKKLEKARKCIEFYADYINYDGLIGERENRLLIDDNGEVEITKTPFLLTGSYGGKLARQTLKELEEA